MTPVRAAVMTRVEQDDPPSSVKIMDVGEPVVREGWVGVTVRAASLNHHDLWTIRGVGRRHELPLILGSDVAGVTDDGREVIVHSLLADPARGNGDELLDPERAMLADAGVGGLAERVVVPARNLVDKPPALTFEQACCLPTAWLTAYFMLFAKARLQPGETVLVQGVGGGVASAAIALAAHAGARVWATSRSEAKRALALSNGADRVFATGERLPERVDVVVETVGAATWEHSMRSVRPGGRVVVAGATTGGEVTLDLNPLFLRHVTVFGSAMGRVADLARLARFCADRDIAPMIDSTFSLDDAPAAVARLASGEAYGKIVVIP